MKKIIFFLICSYVSNCFGLCYTDKYTLLAWNKDGTSALIRMQDYGPEGGEGDRYSIFDFNNLRMKVRLLSSRSDSGVTGGDYALVSLKECQDAIFRGNVLLKALNFDGNFDSKKCASMDNKFLASNGQTFELDQKSLKGFYKKTDYKKELKLRKSNLNFPITVLSKNRKNFLVLVDNNSCGARTDFLVLDSKTKKYNKLNIENSKDSF